MLLNIKKNFFFIGCKLWRDARVYTTPRTKRSALYIYIREYEYIYNMEKKLWYMCSSWRKEQRFLLRDVDRSLSCQKILYSIFERGNFVVYFSQAVGFGVKVCMCKMCVCVCRALSLRFRGLSTHARLWTI